MSDEDSLGLEILAELRSVKVQQRGKQKDHVSTFVHDPTSTLCAAHLAGKDVLVLAGRGLVETKILDPVFES